MRRGFVVGSEYKLETFWLRSQLKRNIVSIKWQNNWTEKKNLLFHLHLQLLNGSSGSWFSVSQNTKETFEVPSLVVQNFP